MEVIRTIKELVEYIDCAKRESKSVGLVPTMGALHAGHLSLVERAVADNDVVVVSVFVNPTQFNNPADLATYPRDEKADFRLLEKAGVTVAFAPSVEEIYPSDDTSSTRMFDLGSVAEVMEGKYRPGHFQGVAQIVSKLFGMVNPDHAYFGEKDFQQIAVIRRMVQTENIDVDIVACPIKREADGLALSSRNVRLTPQQRETAPDIYKTLKYSVEYSVDHSVDATHDTVVERINALPECEVEYFSIVDGLTLRDVKDWNESDYIVGCITVYCGDVRLIDNITYKK